MKHLKFLNLVFALTIIGVGESLADCLMKQWRGTSFECKQSGFDASGNAAGCGDGCSYTYNNGTVTITATQNYGNAKLNSDFFSKTIWQDNNFRDENGNAVVVSNFIIDGFTSFANNAFFGNNSRINSKDGVLSLNNIGIHTFSGDDLFGNIIWTGNSDNGYDNVKINGNLIIEDTASVSSRGGTFSLGPNGKVFCKTDMEKCLELLEAAGASNSLLAAVESFPEGCETLSLNADCSECLNLNFELIDGYCYRKRYTMQEADAATSNDNENMIEWTFE